MSILETIEQGNEPEQGLKPRSELTARELMREVGAVLRLSEAEVAKLGDVPVDPAVGTSTRESPGCSCPWSSSQARPSPSANRVWLVMPPLLIR